MLVDSLDADEQGVGYILAFLAVDDEPDDFLFPRRQIVQRRQGLALAVDEEIGVHDDPGEFRADEHLVLKCVVDTQKEFFGARAFEYVT